jgi:hypothetical protein
VGSSGGVWSIGELPALTSTEGIYKQIPYDKVTIYVTFLRFLALTGVARFRRTGAGSILASVCKSANMHHRSHANES